MSGSCINLDTSSSEDEALSLHSDDDGLSPGSPKRRKATGAAVYKTKFKNEWMKTWPFICGVPGNTYKFRCTICSRDISCSHMGRADVERHIGKDMHKANVKSAHSQRKLQFVPVSDPINDKVRIYNNNISYKLGKKLYIAIKSNVIGYSCRSEDSYNVGTA